MFHVKHRGDVVVVGGGHAGIEAARAVTQRGANCILVTHVKRAIGAMSCNPAVGGIGKGHIVREVDALGGILAACADEAAIHYRMLNRSRGRAVWGPRVQADRRLFAQAVHLKVGRWSRLTIVEDEGTGLRLEGDKVIGLELGSSTLRCDAVVLATGTFLGGRLYRGRGSVPGGRIGEAASLRLSHQLRELSPLRRLKTGTPPRLDGRTIDWAVLQRQETDPEPWTMAPYRLHRSNPQVACAITRTTRAVHDIIDGASAESPLYSGDIEGAGPRYCPSIEDKVRRFPDRDGHQLFLEPEGLDSHIVYPNGISTSLPPDIQRRIVSAIPGLEKADIVQPGYAVEYDFADPRMLGHDLQHREVAGLFLAGQINGTTGYEEAAGQGLVAGANAAAHAGGLSPLRLDRRESYIGVMVDDLVLQGVTEPYRMLTARSERRLHLRADNAEARLLEMALEHDLLDDRARQQALARAERRAAMAGRQITSSDPVDDELAAEAEETKRYAPYVAREDAEHRHAAALDSRAIPIDVDYAALAGLSTEMKEKLSASRPASLGDARRIAGITPAAITLLAAHLLRRAA